MSDDDDDGGGGEHLQGFVVELIEYASSKGHGTVMCGLGWF